MLDIYTDFDSLKLQAWALYGLWPMNDISYIRDNSFEKLIQNYIIYFIWLRDNCILLSSTCAASSNDSESSFS